MLITQIMAVKDEMLWVDKEISTLQREIRGDLTEKSFSGVSSTNDDTNTLNLSGLSLPKSASDDYHREYSDEEVEPPTFGFKQHTNKISPILSKKQLAEMKFKEFDEDCDEEEDERANERTESGCSVSSVQTLNAVQ